MPISSRVAGSVPEPRRLIPLSEAARSRPGARGLISLLRTPPCRASSPRSCAALTSSTSRISAYLMMRKQSAWASLVALVTRAYSSTALAAARASSTSAEVRASASRARARSMSPGRVAPPRSAALGSCATSPIDDRLVGRWTRDGRCSIWLLFRTGSAFRTLSGVPTRLFPASHRSHPPTGFRRA